MTNQSPASTPIRAGFTLDNATEETLRFESVGSGQIAMQIGDAGTFYNEIYDEDGNVVGRTVGITTAVSRDEASGHLINEYKEAIHLPEGTVSTVGTISRDSLMTGEWVSFEAVGVSGELKGLRGVRECRLLPPYPPRKDNRVVTRIVLS